MVLNMAQGLDMAVAGLICMNIIGLVMAGLDKIWAIRGKWRIAEKWFFRMALAGGGPGIFIGCLAFRHKIRNLSFMIGIPAIFLIETGVVFILYGLMA